MLDSSKLDFFIEMLCTQFYANNVNNAYLYFISFRLFFTFRIVYCVYDLTINEIMNRPICFTALLNVLQMQTFFHISVHIKHTTAHNGTRRRCTSKTAEKLPKTR